MTVWEWILYCAGFAAICGLATWLVVFRKMNRRIEGYASVSEAELAVRNDLAEAEEKRSALNTALEQSRRELEAVELRTRKLLALEKREDEMRSYLKSANEEKETIEKHVSEVTAQSEEIADRLHQLQSELDLYSRVADFVDYGIFEEPEYMHETSERYNVEIKRVRDKQKEMIRANKAFEAPDDVIVDGSSQKGSQILSGQAKMMLRAFNTECDFLIGKVSPSNFARSLERIERIAERLEKEAISLMCGISPDFVELKFQECRLVYDFKLKKAAEDEEQRLIKERMREEQKAIREYQRAMAEAEKEERIFQSLLEKAHGELEGAHEEEKASLSVKIAALEEQLHEAREKAERAKSMAEQPRRGHVYIISNIGSFGEDIFKIGLTRRLDPLERVRELGDASVPFTFDVHAVVYNEDAPALEGELHRRFSNRRLNSVNFRKEFFNVRLEDIRAAVQDICGEDVDFRMTALAEEYYESMRLQGRALEVA